MSSSGFTSRTVPAPYDVWDQQPATALAAAAASTYRLSDGTGHGTYPRDAADVDVFCVERDGTLAHALTPADMLDVRARIIADEHTMDDGTVYTVLHCTRASLAAHRAHYTRTPRSGETRGRGPLAAVTDHATPTATAADASRAQADSWRTMRAKRGKCSRAACGAALPAEPVADDDFPRWRYCATACLTADAELRADQPI